MTLTAPATRVPMSAQDRARFDRDGFLLIPGALSDTEVSVGREAILRARDRAAGRGELTASGALHQLSAVSACPELAFLLDHPRVFGHIWSLLGWNIHVYHSHVDVHPQLAEQQPEWWHWHQDGGRQNRELETDPRPRLSVKAAFWFSDVTETGRGNFTLIPGSHRTNWLPGPPSRDIPWPEPQDAVQVTAAPGDALIFDRRIWHARSDNYSPHTRIGAFLGYTYRWIAMRDDTRELRDSAAWAALTPVQRQLLGGAGDGTGDHQWGHDPQTTPLYTELWQRGLLDGSIPALIA